MPELIQPTVPRPGLARDLGVYQATAIVVGTIIGSGIFLVPAEMMQAVGSAKLVYLAWLVGGLLSFFGALTYAELGAMKPVNAACNPPARPAATAASTKAVVRTGNALIPMPRAAAGAAAVACIARPSGLRVKA